MLSNQILFCPLSCFTDCVLSTALKRMSLDAKDRELSVRKATNNSALILLRLFEGLVKLCFILRKAVHLREHHLALLDGFLHLRRDLHGVHGERIATFTNIVEGYILYLDTPLLAVLVDKTRENVIVEALHAVTTDTLALQRDVVSILGRENPYRHLFAEDFTQRLPFKGFSFD